MSPEIIEKLLNVGLFDISFGIESGSQKMLNRYHKNLNVKKTLENLKAINDLVEVHGSFIIGGPGENWETIKETIQFIKQVKLKNTFVSILTLFPGSAFYAEAMNDGLIEDEETYCANLGSLYDRPYVNISDLSDNDLIKARAILMETASEFGAYT